MHTLDITENNIEIIGKLFPNCLTERMGEDGKVEKAIDYDLLRQELSKEIVEGSQERYQFSWPDKKKAIRLANTPSTMTLRPCREESVDFDNTANLYIEGDNLEVLKLLREDYLGKVKMIYIDPPYNTGNDFVYEDDFSKTEASYISGSGQIDDSGNRLFQNTETNGRFHTDWLNMIYPRLKVAKDLLRDDGLIFISIDDNEVENLRKICDEVFGASNFKSTSVIVNNRGGRDYGGIALQHDYLLIYSKSINGAINLIEEKDKEFQYYDELGGFNLMELRNRNVKFNDKNRPNLFYPFYVNPSKKDNNGLLEIALESVPGFIEVLPAKSNGIQTVWRWGKEEKARKNLNVEIFGKANQNGGYMIVQKYRKTTKMQRSIWDEKEFVNERGTEAVKQLFDNKAYFDYPKSVFTIKRVIELGSAPNCTVLDFFSGSSTTADAVMQLNAENSTSMKYIMVQLPEPASPLAQADGYKTLCDVAKERIRRAGKRVLNEQKELKTEGGLFDADKSSHHIDLGFRVLKLDSSNMEDVYYKPEDSSEATLFEDNVKPDRTGEDLLFQVMLECNLPLSAKIKTEKIAGKEVFSVNNGYLIACFDEDVNEEVITAVAKRKPYYFIMRDKSLSSDNVADNFEQIFQAYSKDTIRRIL